MARKVQVIVTDDLDGSDQAEQVSFSLAGNDYTIDLSPANQAKLEAALEPFIEKAERVGRRGGKVKRSSGPSVDNALVRDWAAANGRKVAPRGRIPADVVADYLAARK